MSLLCNDYSIDFQFLKKLGDTAKLLGDALADYTLYVNIELLLGYPARSVEDNAVAITSWLCEKKDRITGLTQTLVVEGLSHYFGSAKLPSTNVDRFISDRSLWATSGGTRFPNVRSDGKRIRSKWANAVTLSDDELRSLLFGDTVNSGLTVSEVIGPGKNRLIVSCHDDLHILMSFISLTLEPYLSQRNAELVHSGVIPFTSSYFGDDEMQSFTNMITRRIRGNTDYCVPIDQSSFDQNQDIEHIRLVLRNIQHLYIPNSLEFRIMERIISSTYTTSVTFTSNNIEYIKQWTSGMPSGWRWTALIDSALNYSTMYAVLKQLDYPLTHLCCQGDDVLLFLPRSTNPMLVVERLQYAGFDVNKSKFYVSNDRIEYLRKIYTKDSILGYPCRPVLSICYNKPQSGHKLSIEERINQLCTSWMTLYSRLGYTYCRDGIVADLKGLLNCKFSVAYNILSTPRSIGGFLVPLRTPSRSLMALEFKRTQEPISYSSDKKSSYFDALSNDYLKSVFGTKSSLEWSIKNVTLRFASFHSSSKDSHDVRPPIKFIRRAKDCILPASYMMPNPKFLFDINPDLIYSHSERFEILRQIKDDNNLLLNPNYDKYLIGDVNLVLRTLRSSRNACKYLLNSFGIVFDNFSLIPRFLNFELYKATNQAIMTSLMMSNSITLSVLKFYEIIASIVLQSLISTSRHTEIRVCQM